MQNPLKEYTATGNPATFVTNVAKGLKQLKIPFTPVQSGTGDPSPQNIRSISGWTGVNVTQCVKNLLDPTTTDYNNYSITRTGEYVEGTDRICSQYFAGSPGMVVTASTGKDTGGSGHNGFAFAGIAAFDANKNFLGREYVNEQMSVSYILPQNTAYFRFYEQIPNVSATPTDWARLEQQLEIGSAATYEPYSGSTIPVSFPAEAGTVYGGELDLVTGVLTATNGYLTFDGSSDEPWLANGSSGYYLNKALPNGYPTHIIMCDHYKAVSNGSAQFLPEGICNMNGTGWAFQINDTSESTVESFKTKLAQSPVSIVYELVSPQTYQLSNIPPITTLIGDNTIWSDTNGSNTVKYLKRG